MLSRFIAKVESLDISLGEWVAGFLGIIFIRFFLENLSSPTPSFPAVPDSLTLIHYGLFYLAAILLSSLVLRIFVPNIAGISKFLLFIFPVLWLPPILDLIFSHGLGSLMAYDFASGLPLLQSFFTLGGSSAAGGITAGIKIELIIILVGIIFYVISKTRSIARAIGAALLTYLAMFFLVALPSLVALVAARAASPLLFLITTFSGSHLGENILRPTVQLSYGYALETIFNIGMSHILYVIDFVLVVIWVAVYNRSTSVAFLKNIRGGRIVHFIVMAIIGAFFAAATYSVSIFRNGIDFIAFVNLLIAFVCAWLFAVGVNDLADVNIDKISNSNRPLVVGSLSVAAIRGGNIFFLIWSLLGGYLAGYWAFFAIATFTAAYYIYSAHPLRLKQVPLLATFLISLACLSALFAGFYFVSPIKLISNFPVRIIVLIIVFFTLMLNVKDIKDIEGDRAEGIQTVPVVFGAHGKEVVGGLFAAAFLAIPIILGTKILFVPSLIAAVLGYIFINAKHYREWKVFAIYFAYIIVGAILLWPR